MIANRFRAAWHNKVVDLIKRHRPRYARVKSWGWDHPWRTILSYNDENWNAEVKPGFVNGIDPIVFGLKENGEDVSLCSYPAIPIHNWGNGFAGISQGAREFFKTRGAREIVDSDNLIINEAMGNVAIAEEDDSQEPTSNKRLVATVLYLSIARPSLVSEIVILDGSGLSGRVIDYQARYEMGSVDRNGLRARLMQSTIMPEPSRTPTPLEIYLGIAPADDGEDRIPVATLFLLSPEDEEGETKPDNRWTPYVQHHLFWNVMHALKMDAPKESPPPIRLATGLAIADTLGNQMLSTINDKASAIYGALNASQIQGRYYTI